MALTVPNVGEVEFLTRMVSYEGSKLKLYSNNVAWANTSTVGSATECATGGYTQIVLASTVSASCWTISTLAGGTSQAAYSQQTFTLTSACTAYGYIITNSAASILLVAEAFTDGPYTIPSGGGTIKVTPKIDGKSETNN